MEVEEENPPTQEMEHAPAEPTQIESADAPATDARDPVISVEQPASAPIESPQNQTIDGVSAVAALIIAAFAVDRFATAFLFLVSRLPNFRRWFPEPGSPDAEVRITKLTADTGGDPIQTLAAIRLVETYHRAVYYFFAVIAAGLVATYGGMGILKVLGFKETNPLFDMAITMLILTAGADRVAAMLQQSGVGGVAGDDPKPMEVQGTLVLDGQTFRIDEHPAEILEAPELATTTTATTKTSI